MPEKDQGTPESDGMEPHAIWDRLRQALHGEPRYITVGTPGPAGASAWGMLEPMVPGVATHTTVREDGSGFTEYPDGTVREISVEEMLAKLASDPE